MNLVMIYSRISAVIQELLHGLQTNGYILEVHQDSKNLVGRAIAAKPDVLVLCLTADDTWAATGVAAIRNGTRATRIIYATKDPKDADAESLEDGVFYYAGNATTRDIIEAVEAAAK